MTSIRSLENVLEWAASDANLDPIWEYIHKSWYMRIHSNYN